MPVLSNMTTSESECTLTDNYVCVESANGEFFEYYFEGTYCQVHEGKPLWLLEDVHVYAYIRVSYEASSDVFEDPQYVFTIYLNPSWQ